MGGMFLAGFRLLFYQRRWGGKYRDGGTGLFIVVNESIGVLVGFIFYWYGVVSA